jgi:hypothetical protein
VRSRASSPATAGALRMPRLASVVASLCCLVACAPRTPVGGPVTAPGLTEAEADAATHDVWRARMETLRLARADEMPRDGQPGALQYDGMELRWLERAFGDAPRDGHSLWISLHGGGGGPAEMNDGQWRNQIDLYRPEEGIYVAPRAPTDNWNLWHEPHIDPMLDRLIEDYVALRGVDPDRVYLLGYSAGGDGVWQLAPRMADRWAAAAMMAGHPNDASLASLRNLPFAAFVGGEDGAYDRNVVVAERIATLGELREADPGGYPHMGRVYAGLPHWMDGRDAEALPWMAGFQRDPWPARVVWLQDDVIHQRLYWLGVDQADATAGRRIEAEVSGQSVALTGDLGSTVTLYLHDRLIDLDRPIEVEANGKTVFSGRVARTVGAIERSLAERPGLSAAATASLLLDLR